MSGAREQVSRLLALVPYLQTRGEVPLAEVARRFGVSPRTLRNDLTVLWYCGLPGLGMGDLIEVDFEALEGEGVVRVDNAEYLTRPLRLDSTEAAALLVALRALREGTGEAERAAVDRALAKIGAAAGDAAALAGRMEVLVARREPALASLRADLEAATAARRQVRLGYYTPTRDALSERVVDPIAVLSAGGEDYLDAWCHLAEDRRLFRLDRVLDARVLDSEAPEHADLAPRDLAEGIFQASDDDVRAVLELSPAARWVAEYYPVDSVAEGGAGTLRVTLRVADPAWLVRLMLRLGSRARLLEPAGLADEVRLQASRALRAYETPRA